MKSMKWKVININVAARAYIDVVGSFQNLAIAVGDPPNPDTVEHCHTFHAAMTAMHQSARRMSAEGIRVTAVSMTATMIYAAQPTADPNRNPYPNPNPNMLSPRSLQRLVA